MMTKIGIALSGGGARGIAHLGVLEALEELGFRPSLISGVSAGAIIAAFYAAGYTPRQILDLTKEHATISITGLAMFPGGLFSSSGLKRLLKAYLPSDRFDQLQMPVFITATDIISGRSVTLSDGSLCDALMGSSAIPGIFAPVTFGSYCLVDGGVLNNFPIECLTGNCDKIIGCHVNKLDNKFPPEGLSKLSLIEKCFHLAIAGAIVSKSEMCAVFIEPELQTYRMFDIKHADQIFEKGYEATMARKDLILSLGKDEIRDGAGVIQK